MWTNLSSENLLKIIAGTYGGELEYTPTTAEIVTELLTERLDGNGGIRPHRPQ